MKKGIAADMEGSEVVGSMSQIDQAVESILKEHPSGIKKKDFVRMFGADEDEL